MKKGLVHAKNYIVKTMSIIMLPRYAINSPTNYDEEELSLQKEKEADVMRDFFRSIHIHVFRNKEACLLHDLLEDISILRAENDVDPVISHTVILKRELVKEFADKVCFFPKGKTTGSKEAVVNLHKLGHSASYNRVLQYSDFWSKCQVQPHKRFLPGIPLHSTIDNNDGRQETLTGAGTTHDINTTLFQPLLPDDNISELNNDLDYDLLVCEEKNTDEIPEYSLGQRKDPPAFSSYQDDESQTLLDQCFTEDIAWSLANGLLSNKEGLLMPLLGSWTAFHRISGQDHRKSLIEYLPLLNQPPGWDVCKHYLDTLDALVNDLDLAYIVAHADEDICSKLVQIIWKHDDLYKNVVVLMGGFHQLRVRQRLIFKRHSCLGYKEWFVDAGTIAAGSVDKALEGKHYYRCMRLPEESFDALVQDHVEHLTNNYRELDQDLLENLVNLREKPTQPNLQIVTASSSFRKLCSDICHELTDSGKSIQKRNTDALKEKLKSYKTDPFSTGPAKYGWKIDLSTNAVLPVSFVRRQLPPSVERRKLRQIEVPRRKRRKASTLRELEEEEVATVHKDTDNSSYLEELLTNVSLLLIQLDEVILDNNNSFNANECPNEDSGYATESSEKFGRQRKLVSKDELLRLFNIHQSWHIVAAEIGVSVKTIYRRRQELGMQISDANGPCTTYTSISQTDLCEAIRDVLRVLPNAGESYVIGACRSRGIFVQRSRIRDAINTIDPVSRALRRTVSIVRRHYSVPGPNSLWYVFLIISIPSS
eukprot:gene14734-16269_t